MDHETQWFLDNLSNRQARFLLCWLEEDEGKHDEKRAILLSGLKSRSPVNGPQSALAYIIDNRCPSGTGMLSRYIGLYPGESVIDALIDSRINNVGSAKSVTGDLLELFEESATTYAKFKDRSGFSAAAARQINNVGAMLFHGAKRAAAKHARAT